MRIVIQRVSQAKVEVDQKVVGEIQKGYMILLGIETEDKEEDADWLCQKVINMRIFEDENGKMNLSLKEVDGNVLVISQFTLHAQTKKGNRPSFIKAARPEQAIPLYEYFVKKLRAFTGKEIQTGEFGAMMNVSVTNQGPVTILMDSKSRE